jgi:histidinol-phosphate aminotransferase
MTAAPRAAAAPPRLREALAGVAGYAAGRPATPVPGQVAYKLSSNENPYPPLPGVLEAVARAAATMNRYPDIAATELVAAIAEVHGATPEEVVVGAGSVAVLAQVVQAAAGPGDEVVFAWRSFESYPIVTGVAGATAVPVALTPGGHHDLEAMAAAVTERTRVVLVCTPNNPTGAVVGAEELERLLEAVPADVLVVLDEAYAEFVRDPAAADGPAARRGRANVVVLRSFSKAHGLAGLRVGYGLAHPQVAAGLRKTGTPFGVSGVAQAGALASLAARAELLERVEAIVGERERVQAALAAQGWRLPRSEANFVWLPVGDRTADLAAAAHAAGLSVRPFDGLGLRVSIGEVEADDRFVDVAAAFAPGAAEGTTVRSP